LNSRLGDASASRPLRAIPLFSSEISCRQMFLNVVHLFLPLLGIETV
jgi:hypothetical protein